MNTTEAKKILLERGFVNEIVLLKGRKKAEDTWILKYDWGENILSNRQLIKTAKCYTSENCQNTYLKSNLKEESRTKERASERDSINKEDFDAIPQNGVVKTGNPWNWD
jgi:hypothetical protein